MLVDHRNFYFFIKFEKIRVKIGIFEYIHLQKILLMEVIQQELLL